MKPGNFIPRTPTGRAIILAILASGGIGFGVAKLTAPSTSAVASSASDGRKILYWYDPMVPQERYDNPNSLSSMGMKTQPKYADENSAPGGPPGVTVDPAARQNLGIRLVTVESGMIESNPTVTGTIEFNQRNVAVIQTRANSFVQRVYNRAPGDVIGAGAPLADVLVPEWAGAQAEYRAVQRTGDWALIAPFLNGAALIISATNRHILSQSAGAAMERVIGTSLMVRSKPSRSPRGPVRGGVSRPPQTIHEVFGLQMNSLICSVRAVFCLRSLCIPSVRSNSASASS
ncbi:MAG: hypothetical protein NVS3B5_15040 [Sphingomicrobium sp.]